MSEERQRERDAKTPMPSTKDDTGQVQYREDCIEDINRDLQDVSDWGLLEIVKMVGALATVGRIGTEGDHVPACGCANPTA